MVAVVVILGGGLLAFITMGKGGRAHLNQDKYRSQWLRIEGEVDRDNQASYHLAILNADKLLDAALKERGFAGNTMGERMKSAQGNWTNANDVWTAHKVRNKIAHEQGVQIDHKLTKHCLTKFKQALKDIGAV